MQKMQKMQQQLAVQPAASGVLRARGPPLSSSAGRPWREAFLAGAQRSVSGWGIELRAGQEAGRAAEESLRSARRGAEWWVSGG
jgi:hypothetical protein